MDVSLQGQVAVVTGGSSGIGYACCEALAAAGAAVVINYHRRSREAEALAARIRDSGGRALAIQADVSAEDDVDRLFAATLREFGTVHILVSNAGVQDDAPFEEMTLAQWNTVLAVNLTSQFLCARAAIREFLRRGRQPEVSRALGTVIAISSVHDTIPWAGHANYAASKGGLAMLAKTLAQEFGPRGIRVNIVSPGAIRTNINDESMDTRDEERELLKLIPYGRVGEPPDVGRVVAWLASDAADYLTGATIVVDGGMELYPGFRTGG